MDYHFEDFTETEYRHLIQLAKLNWEFVLFPDYRKAGKVCLWRHDMDFSVHRAYRLAQIEAEEGVRATYLILLHSEFYNPLENQVADLIHRIQKLGHSFGLHFDPRFYVEQISKEKSLIDFVKCERDFLEQIFDVEIQSFSIHQPDLGGNWLDINEDEIAGMVNAYGSYIRENYSYVSDSNGYWRHRRLREVLEAKEETKLHILTHPELWTLETMSPRARVTRCIEGRAAWQHRWYDDVLAKAGRENVR